MLAGHPSAQHLWALPGIPAVIPETPGLAKLCIKGLPHVLLIMQTLQVVALVGPSGGGKTSIVKLVQRFYMPDAGAVLLDGRDVGAYEPRWLKRRVALVAQVNVSTWSGSPRVPMDAGGHQTTGICLGR